MVYFTNIVGYACVISIDDGGRIINFRLLSWYTMPGAQHLQEQKKTGFSALHLTQAWEYAVFNSIGALGKAKPFTKKGILEPTSCSISGMKDSVAPSWTFSSLVNPRASANFGPANRPILWASGTVKTGFLPPSFVEVSEPGC